MPGQSLADLRQAFYNGGTAAELAALKMFYDNGMTFADVLTAADVGLVIAGGLFSSTQEEILRRLDAAANTTTVSQSLRLNYFVARKTQAITQVRVAGGSTAAGATPTLVRFGIYSIDPVTGDLTLIASTANDTTIFSVANTRYTRVLDVAFNKVRGTQYALGVLIVSAAAMPTVCGVTLSAGMALELAASRRLSGAVAAQADLPANVAAGSISSLSAYQYASLVP